MKKYICIFLSLSLIISMFYSTVNALGAQTDDVEADLIEQFNEHVFSDYSSDTSLQQEEVEQKVYCEATVDDAFLEDEILVVLSKEQSALQQEYTVDDFPGIPLSDVIVLYDYYPEDKNNIILSLVLSSTGKENVLNVIATLEADERIISAEPNYIITVNDDLGETNDDADTFSINSRSVSDIPHYFLATSSIQSCCARAYTDPMKNNRVKVGVVDTGIHRNIPGLNEYKMDENGYYGYDVISVNCIMERSPFWDDEDTYLGDYLPPYSTHGTNVALALAYDSQQLVPYYHDGACGTKLNIGACNNVKLYSLISCYGETVLDYQYIGNYINAISYAKNNDIKILNISSDMIFNYDSGEEPFDQENGNSIWNNCWETAIQNYPGLIITAAGNNSANINNGHLQVGYPIVSTSDNVIVVGGTVYDEEDNQVFHIPDAYGNNINQSNYGSLAVDLFAPDIVYGYSSIGDNGQNAQPSQCRGTSFAAPRVAGAAAVLLNIKEDLTPAQIKHYIMAGVDKSSSLAGKCVSGGSLNIYKSAKMLIADMAYAGKAVFAGNFTDDENMQVAAMTDGGNGMMKVYVWTYENGEFSDPEHWCTINQFYMSTAMYKNICGDFDGNGYDEIATFYTWSDSTTEHKYIFVTGNGYAKRVGDTPFSASVFEGKVAAMNCDSDAADEIVGLCDITNGSTDVYVWNFTGQQGSMSATYSTSPYRITRYFDSDNIKYKVAAGYFTGETDEGPQEFAAIYKGTGSTEENPFYYMIMLRFTENGIAYSETQEIYCDYDVNNFWGRVVACDTNDDDVDEMVFMFNNTGVQKDTLINRALSCINPQNWVCTDLHQNLNDQNVNVGITYRASASTDLVTAADFDGDGEDEIIAFYKDYINNSQNNPTAEIALFDSQQNYGQHNRAWELPI